MPTAPPAPIPQLDGPPPTPPGVSGGAPPADSTFAGMGQAAPPNSADMGGEMQVTQLILQTAQAVAQGLDMLGKMNPALTGLSQQMISMLRSGVRTSLQQGSSTPEPAAPQAQQSFSGMSGMDAAMGQ